MVTYLIATILTGLILVYMVKPENVVTELSKINWTSIILGIAIVGLEAGYIFAYRLGGNVNTTPLIANTALAVALIIIGFILYNENITIKEITGIILCLIGMIIINIWKKGFTYNISTILTIFLEKSEVQYCFFTNTVPTKGVFIFNIFYFVFAEVLII